MLDKSNLRSQKRIGGNICIRLNNEHYQRGRVASEESDSYVMENDKHIGNVDRVRGGGLAALGGSTKSQRASRVHNRAERFPRLAASTRCVGVDSGSRRNSVGLRGRTASARGAHPKCRVSSVVNGPKSDHSLVFDLFGHGQECLLDVCGSFCRCLQEWDTERVGKFLWYG